MKLPALSLVLAYLPLGLAASISKRACIEFNIAGEWGKDGYTRPTDRVFRTSNAVKCTKKDATVKFGDNHYCPYEHYKMGITANSTVNVTVSDMQAVFDAVHDAANLTKTTNVNLNKTILFSYNNSVAGVEVGKVGYWAFTPTMRCWEGMLKDCDSKEETKAVEVCGYSMFDWKESEVKGTTTFVGTDGATDKDLKEMDDIPWPTWEEAEKKWKEENKNSNKDGDSAGVGQKQQLDFIYNYLVGSALGMIALLLI